MIASNLFFVRFISSSAAGDLNASIAAHLAAGELSSAVSAFSSNPHRRNTASWNLLISGYARNGFPGLADNLFDEMPHRDIVSWNAILAAHRLAGDSLKSFSRFLDMLRLGLRPTGSTFTTIISASPPAAVPQLHGSVLRSGHHSNTVVGTSLIGGYTSVGDLIALRRAFYEIPLKNCVSWTALIVGCIRLGQTSEARKAFDEMPRKTIVATTAMIAGLIADGDLAEARLRFDAAENRNAFTWTAMVTGYLRRGCFSDAFRLFAAAPRRNQFIYSAALAASAKLCSIRCGESIHAQIVKSGAPLDSVLSTALVDMYGHCGEPDKAAAAFSDASVNSVAVRNALIGALGRNGRSVEATEELRRMTSAGLSPDETTFAHVLSACAHGGLIEEGGRVFGAMEGEFRVKAGKEHYGCMVDLYGRAGMREEAELAAEGMGDGLDVAAVTAAGGVGLGEDMGVGGYAMMARVCGERGEWEKVREMKERMEVAAGTKGKLRGASWVETSMHNCIL